MLLEFMPRQNLVTGVTLECNNLTVFLDMLVALFSFSKFHSAIGTYLISLSTFCGHVLEKLVHKIATSFTATFVSHRLLINLLFH